MAVYSIASISPVFLGPNRFAGHMGRKTNAGMSSSGKMARQSLSLCPEERDALRQVLRIRKADGIEFRRGRRHLPPAHWSHLPWAH